MVDGPKLIRIYFYIPRRTWGDAPYPPVHGEKLWAEQIDNDTYRIDNVPLYVLDVNNRDVVKGLPDSSTGEVVFQEVLRRGGHSTFRVVMYEGEENAKAANQLIEFLKDTWCCKVERDANGVIAIDVPPVSEDSARAIRGIIEGGVDEDVWARETGFDAMPP